MCRFISDLKIFFSVTVLNFLEILLVYGIVKYFFNRLLLESLILIVISAYKLFFLDNVLILSNCRENYVIMFKGYPLLIINSIFLL